ncbi:hypothetical protein EWM64_g2537 [Hericium alpestre]|uniref:Uncharacterized protein n=1 Tax=Hericium alpestre TaxID=135208 RepID=A0A4Z0A562_9AGAM|nr:hypothetical protein EWM64_g2537 [Hericium alpestre]
MAEPSTSSNHIGQTAPDDDVHLLSDKSSSGSTPSPTLPARSSPPRLRLDGSEIFDTDDFHPALPSPPYETFASVTNLNAAAESYAQQTPPYRSQADLMDTTHDDHARPDPDRKTRLDDDDEQNDVETKGVKPTVHYPADLPTGPTPIYNTIPPGIEHGDLYKLHSRVESTAGTDDEEDESEDYDWSNEEDLVDEETKFEAQMGLGKQTKGWSLRRILSLLFGSLIGSVVLAGVLAAGPILAFFFWYKPHPDAHRRYVMDNIMAWLFWAAANVLLSWWLAMFIDVAPIVLRGAVSLVWGHVSERTKTHIEMYNSVKGTIKPLFYGASAWVSWIILFEGIFKLHDRDHAELSRAPYTEKLSDVVEFLFFLILVWCAQKMLSHAIAFQFHRIAFKERIDDLRLCLTQARELAAHAKALVGVDISQGMVDVYNARVANQGIAPEEMRAVRAALKGEEGELGGAKFDVVVCSMAYHHFASIGDISRVLAFFLKPGGQLMIADITRMTDGGELVAPEYHHIVPHTAGLSEADMRAAFEDAGLREFSFEKLAPGKMHGGAVDFFFARATKPV